MRWRALLKQCEYHNKKLGSKVSFSLKPIYPDLDRFQYPKQALLLKMLWGSISATKRNRSKCSSYGLRQGFSLRASPLHTQLFTPCWSFPATCLFWIKACCSPKNSQLLKFSYQLPFISKVLVPSCRLVFASFICSTNASLSDASSTILAVNSSFMTRSWRYSSSCINVFERTV